MLLQSVGLRPFRRMLITFFLFVTFFFAICPVSTAAKEIVHFSDPQLEAVVRQELNRPTGLLTAADFAQLRVLDAGRQNIASLTGLEYAVNLESLNLYQNEIEDLGPLSSLGNLRVLNLGNNRINDISPLQGLAALEELDLSYNRLKNIVTLKNLANLRELHLEGNEIRELTPLASLKALEGLFLSGNLDSSNVAPLAVLTRLQRLMLADGCISDISFLSNMRQLQWLELCNNQIGKLEPLRRLTKLEWLSLANNRVEDPSALGGLRQLQYLDLNNNRLREIKPLLRLRNIKWLELKNNFLELAEGKAARRDLDKLISRGAEVITSPQRLPLCSGNGLVAAEAGSGGQLLRTPAKRYFTILNYTAGWRVKSFTVVHEGGKPLDCLREVGYRIFPPGTFCWYSISGNNRVGDEEEAFYTVTCKDPGPVQLGLAVQIWPGYADDPARSFYISQVELENVETGDLYTVELERDLPLENNNMSLRTGGLFQEYQTKSASTPADLRRILAGALEGRVSSLEIHYSGKALKMPDDLETMLEDILAEDDYLRYSQRSYNISWSSGAGGDLLLNLRFQYLATREEENYVERQVERILQEILTPGMNDHQKTKAVHDYLVSNVAYDLNCREHSAYAALAKGKAVCQGYALLLYKMLDEAGITTRIITGEAGGENHAWNMVNLDGDWYHIDATWNDAVPDVPNQIRYDYYNCTDEQISATHTWERSNYPEARTRYSPERFLNN